MKITFSILEDILHAYELLTSYKEDHPYFYTILPLTKEITVYQKHILYITSVELLHNLCQSRQSLPEELLCIGYLNSNDSYYCSLNSNLLQTDSSQMPSESESINTNYLLSQICNDIFKYQAWEQRLSDSIQNHETLSDFLTIAYQMFHNPMWIVDDSSCLIASTKEDTCDDPVWIEMLRNGYISMDGSSYIERMSVGNQLAESRTPVLIKVSGLRYLFLSAPIFVQNKKVAMLNIFASSVPIHQSHIDIATFLTNMLELSFLRLQTEKKSEEHSYTKFFRYLLGDSNVDEYLLQSKLQELSWKPKKFSALVVIPCQHIPFTDQEITRLSEQLAVALSNTVTIPYQNNIVCFLNSHRDPPLTTNRRKALSIFLEKYQLNAINGRTFEDLIHTKKEYMLINQSIAAALSNSNNERIYECPSYSFLNIQNILKEHDSLETFCYIGYIQLLNYDRENSTSFTETLYIYLTNNLSPGNTAKKLFIHRSTLDYRLKKIEQIAGIHLNSSEDIFIMNLSFRLMDYMEYLDDPDNR